MWQFFKSRISFHFSGLKKEILKKDPENWQKKCPKGSVWYFWILPNRIEPNNTEPKLRYSVNSVRSYTGFYPNCKKNIWAKWWRMHYKMTLFERVPYASISNILTSIHVRKGQDFFSKESNMRIVLRSYYSKLKFQLFLQENTKNL